RLWVPGVLGGRRLQDYDRDRSDGGGAASNAIDIQSLVFVTIARNRGCELLGLGDGERNRGGIDRDGNLQTCYRRLLRVAPATPYRENAKECRQSQQTRLQRLHTTPHSSWIDRM